MIHADGTSSSMEAYVILRGNHTRCAEVFRCHLCDGRSMLFHEVARGLYPINPIHDTSMGLEVHTYDTGIARTANVHH
jgi:hypothetical protein